MYSVPLGRSAAPRVSPFGLVEQPTLGQLGGLVAVKAEVSVDAAVLGPQDEDRCLDGDVHGESCGNDPFHEGGWQRAGLGLSSCRGMKTSTCGRAAAPAGGGAACDNDGPGSLRRRK